MAKNVRGHVAVTMKAWIETRDLLSDLASTNSESMVGLLDRLVRDEIQRKLHSQEKRHIDLSAEDKWWKTSTVRVRFTPELEIAL